LFHFIRKMGRLKNYQFGDYRWYSRKFLTSVEEVVLPWQIGYARALVNRSKKKDVVGVLEHDGSFKVVTLDEFLC